MEPPAKGTEEIQRHAVINGFFTIDDVATTHFLQGNVVFGVANVGPYGFTDTVRGGDGGTAGTEVDAKINRFRHGEAP